MTDINSRARQLLADIGIKEPAGDPPEIVAQYERLVAFVAEHLRQVANEARETTKPCNKIFDHKWLSPECVETGCQSLLLAQRAERAEELAEKYKWQVRDTCTRAEKAESAIASLRAILAEAGERMIEALDACNAEGFWLGDKFDATSASIQSALRDASPTTGKPE